MPPLRPRHITPVLLAACFLLPASAQQPGNRAVPPQLEKLEEGDASEVTIRPASPQSRITEKHAPGGKVTAIEVASGSSRYILKANDQAGNALPGDGQSSALRSAQWEVLQFEWGGKAEDARAQDTEQTQTASAPPPPIQKQQK